MIKALLSLFNNSVLGINERNQKYIRVYNSKKAKQIADSKLQTKRILSNHNINTPTLYKVIRTKKQLEFLDWSSLPNSFVLKPNKGTGGNGIIVFFGKKKGKDEWIRPDGKTMTKEHIRLHIENILEGRFSMGETPDIALVEERVKNTPEIKPYTYKGVPDVRVIVFNNVPIMAMLRLPTKRSNGTANLHSGAICVGIDMASGVTMEGMYLKPNPIIEDTYSFTNTTLDLDNNIPLTGITIPYWNKILEIAVQCQNITKLGYIGVDIALDKEKGPIVFEVNARPGLGIQVANNDSLKTRLERVKGLNIKNIEHGIRTSKTLFGGKVEKEIEQLSGKKVVNLVEKVSIYYTNKTKRTKRKKLKQISKREIVSALLDTGIQTSRIDWSLAATIGFFDALNYFLTFRTPDKFETFLDAQEYIDKNEEKFKAHKDIERLAKITQGGQIVVRPVIKATVKISGEVKEIEFVVGNRADMIYPVLIGRKELSEYLIDPSKTFITK